ncbi:hypothetical protein RIE95_02050 [Acidithiobacillus thiooxidans]|uniref:hypothetical protein n=1 Tax=Acidithiobacillus thiooxidans TaxID=930 RepID=UPI002861098C|nr:hypothetical protein [Acidithiobacillus thiooxidans]MDR7925790.1 hypothetical protein [Acidithiobacillus thiooxidans]
MIKFANYRYGEKSKLAHSTFSYINKNKVCDFTPDDWNILDKQRNCIDVEARVANIISLLAAQEIDYGWGYPIDPLRHALQTATMIMEAGYDNQMIVTALIHDIGLVSCPENHGEFASTLGQQFLSEGNIWLLRHHQDFIGSHELTRFLNFDNIVDPRSHWEGHPYYDLTATFVDKFDIIANSENMPTASLSFFRPILSDVIEKGLQR